MTIMTVTIDVEPETVPLLAETLKLIVPLAGADMRALTCDPPMQDPLDKILHDIGLEDEPAKTVVEREVTFDETYTNPSRADILEQARALCAQPGGSKIIGRRRLEAIALIMADGQDRTGSEIGTLLGIPAHGALHLMSKAVAAGVLQRAGQRRSSTDTRIAGRPAHTYRAAAPASGPTILSAEEAAAKVREQDAPAPALPALKRQGRLATNVAPTPAPPPPTPDTAAETQAAPVDPDGDRSIGQDSRKRFEALGNAELEIACAERQIDLDDLRFDDQAPPRAAMLDRIAAQITNLGEIHAGQRARTQAAKKARTVKAATDVRPDLERPGLHDQVRQALARQPDRTAQQIARELWVNWQEVDQELKRIPNAAKQDDDTWTIIHGAAA